MKKIHYRIKAFYYINRIEYTAQRKYWIFWLTVEYNYAGTSQRYKTISAAKSAIDKDFTFELQRVSIVEYIYKP